MCKKENTLYVTKLYNKRIYIRSVDNKDCLWLFASGHSPSLGSSVLFAALQPPWSKQAPSRSQSSAWLSPKNPAADPAPGAGSSAALVPAQVPWTLLSLSTLLTIRSFSVPYLWSPIFIYAGIHTGICWLFALLLRSARYFSGVEGKCTLLPPISPPSSKSPAVCYFMCVCSLGWTQLGESSNSTWL